MITTSARRRGERDTHQFSRNQHQRTPTNPSRSSQPITQVPSDACIEGPRTGATTDPAATNYPPRPPSTLATHNSRSVFQSGAHQAKQDQAEPSDQQRAPEGTAYDHPPALPEPASATAHKPEPANHHTTPWNQHHAFDKRQGPRRGAESQPSSENLPTKPAKHLATVRHPVSCPSHR